MMTIRLLFALLPLLAVANVCERVLTHSELVAAGRARAVEFFEASGISAQFGHAVNAAGDVNGDGFEDFVIAAPDENSPQMGALYVVFGRSSAAWKGATFDFSATITPDSASWIRISGSDLTLQLGLFGVAHGDFNGDGLSDLLVGSNSAKAFCFYGHNGTWSSITTAELEIGNSPGFYILGDAGSCKSVGNAGDMNGDGVEDLLVGSPYSSPQSIGYVVFGESGATRSDFYTNTLDGTNGFTFVDGSTSLCLGKEFGSVGDVNGDGLADFAIGSKLVNNNAGRGYVVFARDVSASGQQWTSSVILTGNFGGTDGFVIDGPASGSATGYSIVGAGDVNGDGFADVFVGSNSGANGGAWIIFGNSQPWISPLNLSQLDGTNGFHFASDLNEYWGFSGGGAGDFNGDGFDDIAIGGYKSLDSSGAKTGVAAIIFGHNGSWPAELDRTDAIGSVGFQIDGPMAESRFGFSARGAGDVNGDGLADVVIGASNYGPGFGYAALVFGVADHCAVCSTIIEACDVCSTGFVLNGTVCEAAPIAPPSSSSSSSSSFAAAPFAQSSSAASISSDCEGEGSSSAQSTFSSSGTVVVIETGGGGSASEVAAEIAQLLGVDVGQISVVEITPGTFEITVINEEVAQRLINLIEQCMESASEQH